MTYEQLIERWAKAACQTALRSKKCPCTEPGVEFHCQNTVPGLVAQAIFADLEPAGLALVPVEATSEMELAMTDVTSIMLSFDTINRAINAAIDAGRVRRTT